MSTAKNCFSGTGENESTFAMTCNRLSSFLKDKRSLNDFVTLDVKGKPEISSSATETNTTTVDLLSTMESPVQTSEKSINRLPEYVSLDSFCKQDDSSNKSVTECKTAQMTIFYRGQTLVFDHISADKARDLMLAAGGASSPSSDNQIQNRIQSASASNSHYERFRSQDQFLRGLQLNGSGLPIARRSSLHKFLEKRKDRGSERAPYQLQNRLTAAASSKNKFDLNL